MTRTFIPNTGYLVSGVTRSFPVGYRRILAMFFELERVVLGTSEDASISCVTSILGQHLRALVSSNTSVTITSWAVADIGLCAESLFNVLEARLSNQDEQLLDCFDELDDNAQHFYGIEYPPECERSRFRREFAAQLCVLSRTALQPIPALCSPKAGLILPEMAMHHESGVDLFLRGIASAATNSPCQSAFLCSRHALYLQFRAIGCAIAFSKPFGSDHPDWN